MAVLASTVGARLQVASVPAAHPYIVHLELARAGVTLLPDPPPPGARDGRWWPPVMLSEAWVSARADDFKLMHLHFGGESLTATEFARVLDALRRADRPLVCTIHDISHPQLEDQRPHEEQLRLLTARAAALITLTRGAAQEIRGRWGREAHVIPHPYMHPLDSGFPEAPGNVDPVIGLDLRDLRPNIDAVAVTRTLIAATGALRSAGGELGRVRVRVRVRDHVREPETRARLSALCAPPPWVEIIEGPRPDDAALARSLSELDATVLPYRHGTHSGWLELCWDLGVPVIAPAVGHFADQHADVSVYVAGDRVGLADAVQATLKTPAPRAGSAARAALREGRRRQRVAALPVIADAHRRIYDRALRAAADPG